jgi:hypothetical protein
MITLSNQQRLSVREAILFPQLAQDTSVLANGWFISASGLNNERWYWVWPPEWSSSPIATAGLNLPEPSLPPRRAEATVYEPRTPLGRRLMELRAQIVASGEHLLDWDDVSREVAERRGGARVDHHAETGVR